MNPLQFFKNLLPKKEELVKHEPKPRAYFRMYWHGTLRTVLPRQDEGVKWIKHDPILAKDELSLEVLPDGTVFGKLGDGISKWSELEVKITGKLPVVIE